ncbi:MarR family winged helix-turn-helix transcriptional regulator [Fusibacter bizertensis]|uniref:MarR family winged helix-turn-helix transcriptional regulator n=1 Tax=Fusibacter bizertensis TaxID=1488331 RepID=A0ABT6NF96_9FIRM|nr:MarR family winged helix-turn-helix transcriptional regulator [Fusibacter bizertensis]MDH8679076.1 MarR family winged helix-turn-helix transcriptional regulator [Fusibacter bizertensis]
MNKEVNKETNKETSKEDIEKRNCRLNTCVFFSTTKLAREFNKIAEEAFKKTGLSPSYAVLIYILNQTEKMHQKELGERMFLTPSTITRFLEKLDAKGLVTKTSEGKNVYVSSTVKGKALQAEIVAAWNELHTIYDGILSEEETRQFVNISNKLIDKLGQ